MRLPGLFRTGLSRFGLFHARPFRLRPAAHPPRTERRHGLARLVPRTVRLRLTCLYGALFTVSGAVLLAITYLLVSGTTKPRVIIQNKIVGGNGPRRLGLYPDEPLPGDLGGLARRLREEAVRQHAEQMHALLVQSGIALAIMVVVSILLGWLVAGRVLRPLRTMTATVQRISARNGHERLAVEGPRDELKDLADTVDGVLGRLDGALDAQKRFVANAAHELRTPLTLERALLEEAVTDRHATVATYRSTMERLLALSEQQGRLLEALLTLAGSERGLDHREPVDLSAVAREAVRTPRPESERLGLRIETRTWPTAVSGDPALLERLVANLLDNAVRYNVPGGRVEVRTGMDGAGCAVVRVANTGPVVPPEEVHRLFEPFQRLGGRTARGDGRHGLGLSIVRAIAAAHGAAVDARALPEGGLAIEVTFPSGPAPESATARDTARQVRGSRAVTDPPSTEVGRTPRH